MVKGEGEEGPARRAEYRYMVYPARMFLRTLKGLLTVSQVRSTTMNKGDYDYVRELLKLPLLSKYDTCSAALCAHSISNHTRKDLPKLRERPPIR